MTQQITLDELERYLWQAAVDLRGQIDAAAYKDYIFPLVFFKRICDVRDEEYAGYEQEGGKEFADMMMQDSPIQIPMEAHWNVVSIGIWMGESRYRWKPIGMWFSTPLRILGRHW